MGWFMLRSTARDIFLEISVFVAGLNFALPVVGLYTIPWYFHQILLFERIPLNEIIIITSVLLFGIKIQNKKIIILILALAAVNISVTLISLGLHFQDLARSLRLIVNSITILIIMNYRRKNIIWILKLFVIGMTIGALINMYYAYSYGIIGIIGQNGPGPAMAIGSILCLIILKYDGNKNNIFIWIFIGLILSMGSIISFSKAGLFGGLCSLIMIFFSVIKIRDYKFLKITFIFIVLIFTIPDNFYKDKVMYVINEKIASAHPVESNSMRERLAYGLIVLEIVNNNLFGVSYSGFKKAMLNTEIYQSDTIEKPDDIDAADSEANPHSLFLYYFSSSGYIGLLITIILFLILIKPFYRVLLYKNEFMIKFCFLSLIFTYFLLGLTSPILFNSLILILPSTVLYVAFLSRSIFMGLK